MTNPSYIPEDWKYVGKCHCNATLTIKYGKGDYLIYVMPKRHQFYIKHFNQKIHPITPLNQIAQAINKLYELA